MQYQKNSLLNSITFIILLLSPFYNFAYYTSSDEESPDMINIYPDPEEISSCTNRLIDHMQDMRKSLTYLEKCFEPKYPLYQRNVNYVYYHLLRDGANPNAVDRHYHQTMLQRAVEQESYYIVDLLIRCGAYLNPKISHFDQEVDDDRYSPLVTAVRRPLVNLQGQMKNSPQALAILKKLLRLGAKLYGHRTPLTLALEQKNEEVLKLFLHYKQIPQELMTNPILQNIQDNLIEKRIMNRLALLSKKFVPDLLPIISEFYWGSQVLAFMQKNDLQMVEKYQNHLIKNRVLKYKALLKIQSIGRRLLLCKKTVKYLKFKKEQKFKCCSML
jgi:hypothetical protein